MPSSLPTLVKYLLLKLCLSIGRKPVLFSATHRFPLEVALARFRTETVYEITNRDDTPT